MSATPRSGRATMGVVLRSFAYGLLVVASAPLGLIAGGVVFFATAALTDSLPILYGSALALTAITSGLVSALGFKAFIDRAHVIALAWASITAALAALAWSGLVLRPTPAEYVEFEPTADVRYWDLPTGSRVAYNVISAQSGGGQVPVIWLHGGPGAPSRLAPLPLDEHLARRGFDVYRYHQVGAGLSSRLEPREYTVRRHVDDLEAVREAIGADQVILIGGSWGATLAAHYTARFPERVSRVIFAGPGPLWQPAWGSDPSAATDGTESRAIMDGITLRWVVAYTLLGINPAAANALMPEREMSAYVQASLRRVVASDTGVCAGDASQPESTSVGGVLSGFGFYANLFTTKSMQLTPDPRPALQKVGIPVLVVRGACDRMRPEVAAEYARVFPNSSLQTVPDAAHSVALTDGFASLVKRFVLRSRTSSVERGEGRRTMDRVTQRATPGV